MSWAVTLTLPLNEVQIYDPASNTWSMGFPFAIAGRNFAADTDGTNISGKQAATTVAYHNRLYGNLQLPSESLRVGLAYTYGNCNCYCNCNCNCHCHG